MNVAILGYGTIGSGVEEIISSHNNSCRTCNVTKILDLPKNQWKSNKIVCNIDEIVLDPSIDVVVETMGGLHPAYEYIMAALEHGKHVVTANKAVASTYLKEFVECAKKNHVEFRMEASVGGGIPWIASLSKAKRIDDIDGLYGIFNGTTNYIMDRMIHHQDSFADALSQAQSLGYAEADPTADLDGYDVLNKVILSSSIALDGIVDRSSIPTYSIRNISLADIQYVANLGYTIKYIGEMKQSNGEYSASVMPRLISLSSLEANTTSNFNITTLHGPTIGTLKFYGQGAGKLPTANAIVQDIIDIQDNHLLNKETYQNSLVANVTSTHSYLIRCANDVNLPHIIKKEIFLDSFYYHTEAVDSSTIQAMLDTCLVDDEHTFLVGCDPLD